MAEIVFEESGILLIDGRVAAEGDLQIDDISLENVIDKISPEAISDAAAKIAQIGKGILEAGSDKIGDAKEVELEFGISVGAGGKVLVVKGNVKAELKIKLKW